MNVPSPPLIAPVASPPIATPEAGAHPPPGIQAVCLSTVSAQALHPMVCWAVGWRAHQEWIWWERLPQKPKVPPMTK